MRIEIDTCILYFLTVFVVRNHRYELDVPAGGWATLRANGTVGALRGLETFHQLLQFVRHGTQPTASFCDYVVMQTPLLIKDTPRFTHRGLLVDTGRDFHSVEALKKTIERSMRCPGWWRICVPGV